MNSEYQNTNINKWFKTIVITLLGSFAIEIFIFVIDGIQSNKYISPFAPYTFHTLWEIAALYGIVWIVYRMKVSLIIFVITFLFGSIISSVIWIVIPSSLDVLEPNYYGIESRLSTEMHSEGRYDERRVYDWPLTLGILYHKNSPEIIREFKEEKKFNEFVNFKGFLTWQTGLSYGFIPDIRSIPQYKNDSDFMTRLELILTVGPVVLVELFIMGVYRHFIIFLIAQIVWYIYKKELLFAVCN